jgi:hypothetical protein
MLFPRPRLLCRNPAETLKLRLSDENLLKDAAIAEGNLCLGDLADRESPKENARTVPCRLDRGSPLTCPNAS